MRKNEALAEIILSKHGINKISKSDYSEFMECLLQMANAKDKAYKNIVNFIDPQTENDGETTEDIEQNPPVSEEYAKGFNDALHKVMSLECMEEYNFLTDYAYNMFWKEFVNYLQKYAIGDTKTLLETVQENTKNEFIGYVNVNRKLNDSKELVLEFEQDGHVYEAVWQENDNYACWQNCEFEDSYYGYLLFPTYKRDVYFCLWYNC